MTLNDLYNQLPSQGLVIINGAYIGNPAVDAVTAANLGTADLTVNVLSKSQTPSGGELAAIVLQVALPASTFLNLPNRLAEFTFFNQNGLNEYLLTVMLNVAQGPVTVPWVFTTSYPALELTAVEALPATNQQLVLATVAATKGEVDYPQGLSYQGITGLTGPYISLMALVSLATNGAQWQLRGQIVNGLSNFSMTLLTPPLTSEVDLLVLTAQGLQLRFDIHAKPLVGDPAQFVFLSTFGVQMGAKLGTGIDLMAGAVLDSISGRLFLQLSIVPQNAEIVSLDQIIQLLGGHDWQSYFSGFASSFLDLFDEFGLLSWSASVDLTNLSSIRVMNTLLRAGTRPSQSYVILQDYLVLNYLETRYIVSDPFGAGQAMLALVARLTLPNAVLFDVNIEVGSTNLAITGLLSGTIGGSVADWTQSLASAFVPGFVLSDAVRNFLDVGFYLTEVGINLNQAGTSLSFAIHVNGFVELTGSRVDFNVRLAFVYSGTAWSVNVTAEASIGSSVFTGTITNSPNPTTAGVRNWLVTMGWADSVNPMGFDAIADSLGFEIPSIPTSLDLGLTSISFTFDSVSNQLILEASSANWGDAALLAFQDAGEWVFVFSYSISKNDGGQVASLINLSNLPLVNVSMPANTTLGVDIQVLVTSAAVTPHMAGLLNPHLGPAVQLPGAGFEGGMGFAMTLNFGPYRLPVSLGLQGEDALAQATTQTSSIVGQGTTNSATPVQSLPVPTSDGTVWVDVQKTFGPVFFGRVGVLYQNEKLWFLLDANLRMAGFSMSLMGLRVGSPMDTFAPAFEIDGLGIDMKTTGFELGGALLNLRPATGFQYAGMVVAKAFGVSAAVMGSYGQVTVGRQTVTTMFLFGRLSGLAIGQPYFMVTALAGGVGYNSSLRLPQIGELGQFPFVAGLADPSKVGGVGAQPMDVLRTMMTPVGRQAAWVSAAPGQFWVAAGLSFNSFGAISVNALAILEFGNDLSAALIGMATAQFPKVTTGTTPALVRIQLNLAATYRQSQGFLGIAAVLSDASYILLPSAKITGGFALYTWFAGVHAGDFVMTIGGYHPRFTVPAWYPSVPRLGLNWTVGPTLSLSGDMYMAMTPSAMMVGGALNLNYQDGALRAWFRASFDALIQYVPFSFDVSLGVSVGVSYTSTSWWCSGTYTTQIGANMRIVGAPVGGQVKVDWTVISFTIAFGAAMPKSGATCPVSSWTDFQTLLPPAGMYCALSASTGLLGNYQPAGAVAGSVPEWIVGSDGFSCDAVSALPLSASNVVFGTVNTQSFSAAKINLRPMAKTNVDSVQTVKLLYKSATQQTYTSMSMSTWTITAIKKAVPSSLWGPGTSCPTLPSTTSPALLTNQLLGLHIVTPPTKDGHDGGEVLTANLMAANSNANFPFPVKMGTAASGQSVTSSPTAITTIVNNLGPSAARRNSVWSALQGLGFNLGNAGPNTPPQVNVGIQNYFDVEPLLTTQTQ